ncbi:hypothetical protein BDR26DRAFT_860611 [Obelidium mucronatum]|nr:hypothetical protein BDR26DRAFT_860611 [Obelidium mucronatum]
MVLYFQSNMPDSEEPVTIYMGRDKYENEQLIEHGWDQDVWFHVDKISSAHVYLRMPDGMAWDQIPENILIDCGQLTKANSIEGNKLNNQTILYTPWSNLKKTPGMETGQVTFHKPTLVKKVFVRERVNAIVNRLNKTKQEINNPDLALAKIEKLRQLKNAERLLEKQLRREEEERKKEYKAIAEQRSYKGLMDDEEQMRSNRYYTGVSVKEAEEDFM